MVLRRQLWTEVLKKVKSTGGTCYVMAKGTGPNDRRLEGNAQQGEVKPLPAPCPDLAPPPSPSLRLAPAMHAMHVSPSPSGISHPTPPQRLRAAPPPQLNIAELSGVKIEYVYY